MTNWQHHETQTSTITVSWWDSQPESQTETQAETQAETQTQSQTESHARSHRNSTGSAVVAESAPVIVLLHGFSDDAQCFHPFAEAAGWTDCFRVITPDAVGHGGTPLREVGSDLGHSVFALAELLDAANVERITVMGHSMGALGASLFAAAYPDRVDAVILEDPVWRMHEDLTRDRRPSDGSDHPLIAWVKSVQKLSLKNRKRLAVLENRTWSDAELDAWARAKERTDPRLFDGPVRWSPHPWWQTAAALTMPTLLLTGDPTRGAIVNDEAATFALGLMPRGERAHIESATHTIRRDQTQIVAKLANEFLERALTNYCGTTYPHERVNKSCG